MATLSPDVLQLTDDEIQSIMAEKAKELFQLCDTESRGFLTRHDLQKLQDELALTTEQLDAVYDSLDADGNGRLTHREFTEGFGNFLGLQFQEQRRLSVYDDGLPDSPGQEDQFHTMMDQFGAYGVFEDQEAIKSLWERLKTEEPHLVMSFERCLGKISSEMKKTHQEYKTIEGALKNRTSAHDEEVKQLYEEMEQQIKQEKDRFKQEEKAKERQLRSEMEKELAERDSQLQEVLRRQKELEQQLSKLNMTEAERKQENEQLLKDKTELLRLLETSHDELEEQKSYVENVRRKTKDERKDRVLQAVHVTHGIALERETLVRQLDLLKDMNKKLRDDHDIAESRKISRVDSGDDAKSKLPLTKQGSVMSNYFSPTLSHSSRTSGNSFQFDDLQLAEDDSVDYDDDVIDKEINEIYNNSVGDGRPGAKSSDKDLNSNDNNNDRQQKSTSKIPKPVTAKTRAKSPKTSPSRDGSLRSSPQVESRNSSAKSSPGEQRRLQFIKYSKQGTPRSRSPAAAKESQETQQQRERETQQRDRETQQQQQQQQDSYQETGTFVSVSLDSSLDRQSPIGAYNAAGATLDSQNGSTPTRLFKVVFVGDSGVGKSSFIHRFCQNQFSGQFCATIGVDFQVKSMVVGSQVVAMQLWDTAGQERYRSITKQYFRKSDGIVVMYDVTSESSFCNVRQWMDSIEEGSEDNAVIMLLGNKTDLAEDDSRRPVKYKDGVQLADSYGCLFYETSAKLGKNIQECMVAMASMLEDKEDKQMEAALQLQQPGLLKKSKCCGD